MHALWSNHTKHCSPVEPEIQFPETPCTETLGQVGTAGPHLRIETLAQSLAQRASIAMNSSTDDIWMQCYQHGAPIAHASLHNVFGSEVLRLIAVAYQKPWKLQQISDSVEESDQSDKDEDVNTLIRCDYEGYDSAEDNRNKASMDSNCIKILFEQVQQLQTRLDGCEDDDETRALEEDITGKILLACCRGVYHELAQVLSKVVDCLVHDKDVECGIQDSRVIFFHRIAEMLYDIARESDFHHTNHHVWWCVLG